MLRSWKFKRKLAEEMTKATRAHNAITALYSKERRLTPADQCEIDRLWERWYRLKKLAALQMRLMRKKVQGDLKHKWIGRPKPRRRVVLGDFAAAAMLWRAAQEGKLGE